MMRVSEIFNSIDGEGLFTGCLSTFIRLAGCNLRCSYCDTPYALKQCDGYEMEICDILQEVEKYGCKRVTLTGGEPLSHIGVSELIECLCSNGYHVNIETNGSIPIGDYLSEHTTITMDYKTPSSGCDHAMLDENVGKLRISDALKFVVRYADFDFVKQKIVMLKPKCSIFISPIYGICSPARIVDYMKELTSDKEMSEYIGRIRLQMQLHKIIWGKDERGV